jgi:hypothetical protein
VLVLLAQVGSPCPIYLSSALAAEVLVPVLFPPNGSGVSNPLPRWYCFVVVIARYLRDRLPVQQAAVSSSQMLQQIAQRHFPLRRYTS